MGVERDAVAAAACVDKEAARALKSWENYQAFCAAPAHKCGRCWLMLEHCCCAGIPKGVTLRPKIAVVMHHLELGRHLGSNTAKLLLDFGAELFAWHVTDHDDRLRRLLQEDPDGTVVLFPAPGAVSASELRAAGTPRERDALPRCIVVLDGGWRECKKMNDALCPDIARCVVTTATREEFGGTRKYGGGDPCGRVQTAAAFIALLQELGEDAAHVSAMKAGLTHFMN